MPVSSSATTSSSTTCPTCACWRLTCGSCASRKSTPCFPLAYPANPYHRLIKNYQLVRDSINDPVQDGRLAGRVFAEQWDALVGQLSRRADIPALSRLSRRGRGPGRHRRCPGRHGHSAAHRRGPGGDFCPGLPSSAPAGPRSSNWCCSLGTARPTDRSAGLCHRLAVGGRRQPRCCPRGCGTSLQVPLLLHQLRKNNCRREDCAFAGPTTTRRNSSRTTTDSSRTSAEPSHGGRGTACRRRSSMPSPAAIPCSPCRPAAANLPLLPAAALMRYQRRNLLTAVVSPLQALMKDQVDNFSWFTGTRSRPALYGMLTMPERGEVLEGVRPGRYRHPARLPGTAAQRHLPEHRQPAGDRLLGCSTRRTACPNGGMTSVPITSTPFASSVNSPNGSRSPSRPCSASPPRPRRM